MNRAFEPFDETQDPRYLEWKNEDPTDISIPDIKGFVTDYVYATRGREIASLYGVWSALFLISSVIQRDAWFTPPHGDKWLDREYLNMYVLFVGPAGCGKSSAISYLSKVYSVVNMQLAQDEEPIMQRKLPATVSNMATPEAFLSSMFAHIMIKDDADNTKHTRKSFLGKNDDGSIKVVKAIANGIGLISEFGSLLSKNSYQAQMSTILLDLYDSPAKYEWNTIKRGKLFLPEVFFNFVGATTVDGLSSNVNPSVMKDGFMSRTIVATIKGFTRKRHFRFSTACNVDILSKRLLWIAKSSFGAYTFDNASANLYKEWYEKFMHDMNKHPDKAGYMIRNRTLVIKLSILLKISEYTPGNIIEERHLKAAMSLVDYTYKNMSWLVNTFGNALTAQARESVTRLLLTESNGATRRKIAKTLANYSTEIINTVLNDLWIEGSVFLITSGGKLSYEKRPEFTPNERYTLSITARKEIKRELQTSSEGHVSKRKVSNTNSKSDAEKQVGDILSVEKVWG